eukprot:Hpha_TRINITY_DN7454_c0_g1::TRINITY_DN7454_c0_g1_i1::g.95971::m.95971
MEAARGRGCVVRRFRNYGEWMKAATPGEVYVLTETWPCKRSFTKGARQVAWHLTVQDTLKLTYNPATTRHYLPPGEADPYACAPAVHTHFLAASWLNVSSHALLAPPMSPLIVKLAEGAMRGARRALVVIDGDAGLPGGTLPAAL